MKRRVDIERVITWPASASERRRVHPSLGEALHDCDNAAVEAWLQAFLSGSGGNTELAGVLATREWCYLGPVASRWLGWRAAAAPRPRWRITTLRQARRDASPAWRPTSGQAGDLYR